VAKTGCQGFETHVWGFVMHVSWSKWVAGVQRRTKDKKEEKNPANMHITCVPGCKNENNINKPLKHTYTCPGGAKKENKQKKSTRNTVHCVSGARKEKKINKIKN
jgi:hypothetical protein